MDNRLIEPFIHSTKQMLKDMTGISIRRVGNPQPDEDHLQSLGVTTTVSFSGALKGRFILNVSSELAIAIVSQLMGTPSKNARDKLFLAGLAELTNVIAGDANTVLNDNYNLGLRLAPPTVFTGRDAVVATTKIASVRVACDTAHGPLEINLDVQGGLRN